MNMPSRLSLAFAALALAGVAQAQETTVLEPVSLQKQISTPITRSDMKVLAGVYQMQDGRQLRVDGHGLRMRISLGNDEAVAMTPSADGVWRSTNGELHMQFHGEDWGTPDSVLLTMPSKNWSLASVNAR
ncbi:hypothetical protein H5407_18840 [Mitsuaria sp. WAJ17]|uniref:hypothetical protein n=1 Tax=Mitsuaria sp. WAJ17 TaxID=2761452 RepID=UPI00160368E6|nr:hypothetical protein [Mitsuaria sp. WAJ17]MBB2487296.1 hypothetical protein [Mitsuaria sp. WAJ17]